MLCSAAEAAKFFQPVFDAAGLPADADALSLDYIARARAARDVVAGAGAGAGPSVVGLAEEPAAEAPRAALGAAEAAEIAFIESDPAVAEARRFALEQAAASSDDGSDDGPAEAQAQATAPEERPKKAEAEEPSADDYGPFTPDDGVTYQGVVKLYNAAKAYGFLQSVKGGPDVYVSATGIVDVAGFNLDGLCGLCAGEPVEFQVTRNTLPNAKRKLRAQRVTGPEGAAVHVQNSTHRRRGVVRFFAEDKHYGFIVPDDDGDDVFFHTSQLLWDPQVPKGECKMEVGFTVEFTLLDADGTITHGRSQHFTPPSGRRAVVGRKVAFAVTDASFVLLDPASVPRCEVNAERDAGATEQRKRRREQEDAEGGPRVPLLSGFSGLGEDGALATW